MANSEFGYVRQHETWDALAPANWIVVRIDGRGFSKFTKRLDFAKPNDRRAIDLMNAAAREVVRQFVDIVVAYGQSDEFSFVFDQATTLFDRRASKIATTIATTFTVEYAMQWPDFFPDTPLTRPYPTFDGRTVLYPNQKILRDYLSWRQADCHINNLYNTTFWTMVLKGGMSNTDAEEALKGTLSSDKNEILFSRFGINYNHEEEIYKKGTVIYRRSAQDEPSNDFPSTAGSEQAVANTDQSQATSQSNIDTKRPLMSKTKLEKERKRKIKAAVTLEHVDIIKEGFWVARPWILGSLFALASDSNVPRF